MVGGVKVVTDPGALRPYKSRVYRLSPTTPCRRLPEATEQVSASSHGTTMLAKYCAARFGYILVWWHLPLADAVLLRLGKLISVLKVDDDDRIAVVKPAVKNLVVTQAVEASGFHHAPDPSR